MSLGKIFCFIKTVVTSDFSHSTFTSYWSILMLKWTITVLELAGFNGTSTLTDCLKYPTDKSRRVVMVYQR